MSNYKIYTENSGTRRLLWDSQINDFAMSDIHYKPVAGSAGTLEFKIYQTHPRISDVQTMTTDVYLYKEGLILFRGRVIEIVEDFYKTETVTCEGDLNFLVDSLIEPYEYTGGITDFVTKIVTAHNAQVETRKQFTVGQIAVTDSNDYLLRSDSNYNTAATALKKLTDSYGGYFRVRHEANRNYLDYLYNFGTCSQIVRFGENLIDVSKDIDPSTIITCLVPLGAKIDGTTEEGAAGRINIKSVNNGKMYVENPTGISNWGYIWGAKEWDDVTVAATLKKKAEAYLAEQILLPQTVTLTALDLSIIDASVDDFGVGEYIKVTSSYHGMDASDGGYILAEADIDLSAPQNSTITLGGRVNTMTMTTAKQLAEASKSIDDITDTMGPEIESRIEAASDVITGGQGGYVVIHRDDDGHPDEILLMNTDDPKTASHVIRMNQNGIGFSTTGYNPTTFDAAITINGAIVANKVTSGTMLADRIRGGSLEVGGTELAADGSIVIKDATGNTVGTFNSSGISISGGTITGGTIKGTALTLGGGETVNGKVVAKDGSIEILNTSNQTIGKFNASGISVTDGTITGGKVVGSSVNGSTINGATFYGGTYNIGSFSASDKGAYNPSNFTTNAYINSSGYHSKNHFDIGTTTNGGQADFYGDLFHVYQDSNPFRDEDGLYAVSLMGGGIKIANPKNGVMNARGGLGSADTVWGTKHDDDLADDEGNINLICDRAFIDGGLDAVNGYFDNSLQVDGEDVKTSDIRLKDNVQTIEQSKSEDFIYGLRPVSFTYKKNPDKTHHGFIAQEVQKITDGWDLVSVMDLTKDKHLGISYTEIIADLVNVIQSQDKRIKALEERI